MKILITGANGQLAREFIKQLSNTNHTLLALSKAELDISDLGKTIAVVTGFKPDIIINCAAYNFVDDAEKYPALAYKTNAIGVKNLAYTAAILNSYLVHYSTDYVFNGNKQDGLYTEDDHTQPVNEYGKSKLLGEKCILEENLKKFLILRVSWVYGEGKQNFLSKLLAWSQTQENLKVAVDEFSVPTSTRTITEVTLKAFDAGLTGIYHLVNTDFASRYEWAREFFKLKGINKFIAPAYNTDFNLPAKRPKFSAMTNEKINKQLSITIPDWREEMRRIISGVI